MSEETGARFIREELKELLELVELRERESGKPLTAEEQNDLLLLFIAEHGEELASHAFAILAAEDAAARQIASSSSPRSPASSLPRRP